MKDENRIGYWMEYHIQPNRAGYGERYTLVEPIRRLGHIEVHKFSARDLAQYRDARMEEVKTETVRRELRAIRRALTIARHELDVPLPSIREAYERIRMPEMAPPRERRLSPEEEAALFAAADGRMAAAMTIAMEAGMRRRELCALRREDIDLSRGVAYLSREATKTNRARGVPLSEAAEEAFRWALDNQGDHPAVIGYTTNSLNIAWQRTRRRAAKAAPSVADYRWHDFRHECLSRLAERGWSALEIQAVSGHSTPAMLSRYVNMRPDDLVDKLRRM